MGGLPRLPPSVEAVAIPSIAARPLFGSPAAEDRGSDPSARGRDLPSLRHRSDALHASSGRQRQERARPTVFMQAGRASLGPILTRADRAPRVSDPVGPSACRQSAAMGEQSVIAYLREVARNCAVAGAAAGGHSRSGHAKGALKHCGAMPCGKGPACRPCPLHSRAFRAAPASHRLCPSVRRQRLARRSTCRRSIRTSWPAIT